MVGNRRLRQMQNFSGFGHVQIVTKSDKHFEGFQINKFIAHNVIYYK